MDRLKLMVVTTSRADYGILFPLLKELRKDAFFAVQLIVTGSHLSHRHGLTINEIQEDGFEIAGQVDIHVSGDDEQSVCSSISKGLEGFSKVLCKCVPEAVVVLGDRYELMSVCIPAVIHRVPIVHIHGGEVTRGAVDDAIRHAVTKMSSVHFPSLEVYAKRIIQMGENPERVFTVGALAIDNIMNTEYYSKDEMEKIAGLDFQKGFNLVTYHPVTLDGYLKAAEQVEEVLEALAQTESPSIITMPNADAGGLEIYERINGYIKQYPLKFRLIKNFGRKGYLSAMKYARVMVGNSSSGIIESPSFGLPVVNIGDRQEGRFRAPNIIDCRCNRDRILEAYRKSISNEFMAFLKNMESPYGGGKTAGRICTILKSIDFEDKDKLLKKGFFDMNTYRER